VVQAVWAQSTSQQRELKMAGQSFPVVVFIARSFFNIPLCGVAGRGGLGR
jgi:hypothetical protein